MAANDVSVGTASITHNSSTVYAGTATGLSEVAADPNVYFLTVNVGVTGSYILGIFVNITYNTITAGTRG